MARLTPFYLVPALIAAASHAGEVTIEPRPFFIENSFTAAALPTTAGVPLKLDPKVWSSFEIAQIAAHGTQVSKGELLIRFDSEEIDRKIQDARHELEVATLTLAQTALDSQIQQETAADKLATLRRAAETAKEENTYFSQVRRKASEDRASQSLKRSEQILANQHAELKRLSKMYEADDITENTEEIILARQQDAVSAAEFALRMENLDHQRTLSVILPREAQSLADTERNTAIRLKKAAADIPRAIELKQLALKALETANQRAKQNLSELEADRAQFEFKAPADGSFYHGLIENGPWSTADAIKTLFAHGHPPAHLPFATFVPANAKLTLVSFVDEATARALKPELAGTATLAGREDVEIPITLVKLASSPGLDGSYRADLAASWPKDLTPAAGATAQIRLISYQQPAAIAVPTKALRFQPQGWTVEVKLADGKTEHRPVKRGRVSDFDTEILSGLEIGQVIVVP